MDFISHKHPSYAKIKKRTTLTWDFYTGDVLDKRTKYLVQHKQGESNEAYEERVKILNYTNHMSVVVDSLAGMLMTLNERTKRTFGALGDKMDLATTAGKLYHDADGMGTSWVQLVQKLITRLIALDHYYVCVEGITDEREARIELIDPRAVHDWMYDDGRLVGLKVMDSADVRPSIYEASNVMDRYTIYTLDGYRRFNEDGDLIGEGEYEYYNQNGLRRLPFIKGEVPLNRPVGYLLAKNAESLLQLESARDFDLFTSNFKKLRLDVPLEEWDDAVEEARVGFNITRGANTDYIAPPTDPTRLANDTIEQKTKMFYRTAMREYGDAARERTATEIRQEQRQSAEAFLTLIAQVADDVESEVIHLLHQVYFPGERSKWDDFEVKRPESIVTQDLSAEAKANILNLYASAGYTKRFALMEGLGYTREEADEALQSEVLGSAAMRLAELSRPAVASDGRTPVGTPVTRTDSRGNIEA